MLYRGNRLRVPPDLFEQGLDQLCEAVACPVETALHRPQVATRDVGDLGVALPLQLAQHEDGPGGGRELPDALVDRFLWVALAGQGRRPCGRGPELQWPV